MTRTYVKTVTRKSRVWIDLPQGQLKSWILTQTIWGVRIAYKWFIRSSRITTSLFTLIPKQHKCFDILSTEPVQVEVKKFIRLMFQMQICIIVVLLLSSCAVSAGLEKVLRQAEFIADIYKQFPHSCIFILNTEEQQQGEDTFYIIYSSCVCSEQKCDHRKLGGKFLSFPVPNICFTSNYAILEDWKSIRLGYFIFTDFAKIVVTLCALLCSEFVIFWVFWITF